jgi:hypothetical protein
VHNKSIITITEYGNRTSKTWLKAIKNTRGTSPSNALAPILTINPFDDNFSTALSSKQTLISKLGTR